MGFFHKHDTAIAEAFKKVMEAGRTETESRFFERQRNRQDGGNR